MPDQDTMKFARNTLGRAMSPYLTQHTENPVWWHEWSTETLDYAKRCGKPIFVSVGYSTCHWCHVMAREAFSDTKIAAFLNENFVSIKVDREQRPDIDRTLMEFLVATTGSGGWPLNAFLTPNARPFFATTYLPVEPRSGSPGFLPVLERIIEFYRTRSADIKEFVPEPDHAPAADEHGFVVPDSIARTFLKAFDPGGAGFGATTKFPPHTALLYTLYAYELTGDEDLAHIARETLDIMRLRGLKDHLQGGFFRYCVDRAWTIPHFEKMLYDQALTLWTYSLAASVFSSEEYRAVARDIHRCLQETFRDGALYSSAHDADTDHVEGKTYTWKIDEIKETLTAEELAEFLGHYSVSAEGNFEGRNHLLRSRDGISPALAAAEDKLLEVRRRREQPFTDRKIVTDWNAILGVALIHAERYAGIDGGADAAAVLMEELLARHMVDGELVHTSLDGNPGRGKYLTDYASVLLLLTYLDEHFPERFSAQRKTFRDALNRFRSGDNWLEAITDDHAPVPAATYDSPVPSGVSLARLALERDSVIEAGEYGHVPYRDALHHDFWNIAALLGHGLFHVVEHTEPVVWNDLPVTVIFRRSDHTSTCTRGLCTLELPIKRGGAKS